MLSTFSVTNADDSGPGTLRQAVIDANEHEGADKIRVSSRVRGDIALTSGEITITDDVTLQGPGQHRLTISGEGASRVFSVLGAGATFKDLTIANGLATDTPADPGGDISTLGFAIGGGIVNLRGSVQLNRVTMHNNHAVGLFALGGAVGNFFAGALTVENSKFTDNSASGFIAAGGAMDNDVFSSLSVSRSQFTNNAAIGLPAEAFPPGVIPPEVLPLGGTAVAGAVKTSGGSQGEIYRGHFRENVAQAADGAAAGSDGGFLALGGAVENQALSLFIGADFSSTMEIDRGVFVGNEARGGSGADGEDGGNGSLAAGGAVANAGNSSMTTVRRSHFHGNGVTGGDGGDASSGIGGAGGDARGGALDNGFPSFGLGTPRLIVEDSFIGGNFARGGDGGSGPVGGDGGNGIGGGAANSSDNLELISAGDIEVDDSNFVGNSATGGQAGSNIGGEASLFVRQIVADYEFLVLPGGPLDGAGFPADVFIPVQAVGTFTFALDETLLNDPTVTSVPFTDVSGTLDGVYPAGLLPFTLGPYEFISGSLNNIVRDSDGSIISGDVVGLSMEWEMISYPPGMPPLRVYNTVEIPFDAHIDSLPFSNGTVLAGAPEFDISLDTGQGADDPVAAIGRNRTLTVVTPKGGDGLGGAIANTGGGTMLVHSSLIVGNRATGEGERGNGQAGGIYNDIDSALDLQKTWIIANRARAHDGLGQGGGVFSLGNLMLDRFTRIWANKASDEGDNLLEPPAVKPFHITGSGTLAFFPPLNVGAPHDATGHATHMGSYSGLGFVRPLQFIDPPDEDALLAAEFDSEIPQVFVADNGDELHFDYGRGDLGPGVVQVYPAAEEGLVFAVFVAEFTPVVGASTGRYASVVDGSFIMTATTEPFDLANPVDIGYSWEGEGWIEFA